MTEKRFTIHNRGLQGQFIKESGEFLTVDMVCEMLNDFYEENEQLKQSINNLMDSNDWWEKKAKQRVQELEKENEQLKSILSDTVDHLESRINPNENTRFAVTLIVNGKMYCKIKEIIT